MLIDRKVLFSNTKKDAAPKPKRGDGCQWRSYSLLFICTQKTNLPKVVNCRDAEQQCFLARQWFVMYVFVKKFRDSKL